MRTQALLIRKTSLSLPFITLMFLCHLALELHAGSSLFHIECPPDTSIHCDDELWDLSIYGNAIIYGYGEPQSAGDPEWVEYNLNSCNVGTIVRTWVAYDYSGNAYSCSQTIYVGGAGYIDIDWPPNYTIHDCNPATDPDDLPPPYDYPVIHDYGDCSQIMYSYEDKVFNINPPACKKILREWTVIDWCTYNPNQGYGHEGIWEHTQIIKIAPENPPVIECPEDITVSSGADCYSAYVNIPPATGYSDCGASVIITNHSPYATNNGADASGHYPVGVTWVTFKADDGCGGTATCKMKITVTDMKKPTPICYYGVSISLMQMPDGYYMDLRPEFFDKGSFDNCTPKHKLTFDIEPKRVDCDDIGDVPVKIYVTDESGNTDYCTTFVHVQDNMGMCPPTSGTLEGAVLTDNGSTLEHVKISLAETEDFQMTSESGEYRFVEVDYGKDYTVVPSMEENNLNGVSTLDLLFFMKHITGAERLANPYQYLAADLNNSGNVSVTDMAILRNLILKNIHQVPSQSAWKFIDATHQFSDPFDPFAEPIPQAYVISSFSGDMQNINFVGVKLGDISGDAVTENGAQDVQVRNAPLYIQTKQRDIPAGEEFEIPVFTRNFKDMHGFQFALRFDPLDAEYLGISQGGLDDMDLNNFGFSALGEGVITTSYARLQPFDKNEAALFSIRFKAATNISTEKFMSIDREAMPAEAYTSGLQVIPVKLEFTGEGSVLVAPPVFHELAGEIDAQVFPNPFGDKCSVSFNLMHASPVDLVFYNINGGEIARITRNLDAGYHEIPVSVQALGIESGGMIFCDVITNTGSSTLKLIITGGGS